MALVALSWSCLVTRIGIKNKDTMKGTHFEKMVSVYFILLLMEFSIFHDSEMFMPFPWPWGKIVKDDPQMCDFISHPCLTVHHKYVFCRFTNKVCFSMELKRRRKQPYQREHSTGWRECGMRCAFTSTFKFHILCCPLQVECLKMKQYLSTNTGGV